MTELQHHPETLIAELHEHLKTMTLRYSPVRSTTLTLDDVFGKMLDAVAMGIREWHANEAHYLATRPPSVFILRDSDDERGGEEDAR